MSQLLNKQHYSLPPLEDNHDQPKLIPFFPTYETSSSQYDHIPYQTTKTITYSDEDHDDHQDDDHHQYYPSEESNESIVLRIATPVTKNEKDDQNTKMYSGSTNSCLGTAKWMSSKMRLMRKMMNSYPRQKILQPTAKSSQSSSISNGTNSSNGCVRACSDCNTTKTPLWRSGPQGPKSLCNACGIRQRKARKAMSAAAEKGSNDDTCKIKKVSVGACNAVIPYKKRYKLEHTRRKIQLAEDFSSISLKKKKTSFHPQDEKEAAILLMALSCDLIYG